MRNLFLLLFAATVVAPEFANAQIRPDLSQDRQQFEVSVDKYLMGTLVEATVVHHDVAEARRKLVNAFDEIRRIEDLMSVHKKSSALSAVNRDAAVQPVQVDGELFGILDRSIRYCEESDGLFDVTIGPLSALWGFNADAAVAVPKQNLIDAARQLVGCGMLILDAEEMTVFFARSGVAVDLGGIAKGYAVDRAAASLRAAGIDNFLINAGGDLFVSGEKSAGVPWRVGIKHPRRPGSLAFMLNVVNEAVVTSGDYERFVEIDGVRYHHILNPRTGFPATGMQSVTVAADSAERADVIATVLFISGNVSNFNLGDFEFVQIAGDGSSQISDTMSRREGFAEVTN